MGFENTSFRFWDSCVGFGVWSFGFQVMGIGI